VSARRSPLDFPAEVIQHIPDLGEHLIRYYGSASAPLDQSYQ
jgi:hypothetical protein